MIRKIVLCCALLALGVSAGSAEPRRVMLDRVVAVVGGSSILWSEVNDYAGQLAAQHREQGYTPDRDPRSEALELLLTQKLLFNQAFIDSVDVSFSEISQRVESYLQMLIDEAGSIAALEKQQNMPIFHVREMYRRRFEEQAYAQAMQGAVVGRVKVIPGEVERYYRRIDKDSLPTIADQYVYAQITKFPFSRNEARQRAKERLLDMRERIITGQARFDVMARMYSIDASAISGGMLDPQPLDGFVRPFADALAELRPGQVSEVIETKYGYHLVQLVERRGRIYHARHIVIRPDYTVEEEMRPARMLDSIVRLIRKDSLTFDEAALRFSDDAHSKMNGGVVTNHDLLEEGHYYDARYTETSFLREDFGRNGKSLDDYNALRRLKPGEISDAFQSEDAMGNKLSKVVKLVRIIPAHTASLEQDYIRVEQLALNAKRERVFREWLDRKIEGMYVYVDPEFRYEDFDNKNWFK